MDCTNCEYYLECEHEKERLAELGVIFKCLYDNTNESEVK